MSKQINTEQIEQIIWNLIRFNRLNNEDIEQTINALNVALNVTKLVRKIGADITKEESYDRK